jgi:lipoprotein-anchoring transpeptidase ErfK/SrfK
VLRKPTSRNLSTNGPAVTSTAVTSTAVTSTAVTSTVARVSCARVIIIAVCAIAGLLAAACSGTAGPAGSPAAGSSSSPAADAWLRITPAAGSTAAQPGQGITVTAARGTLTRVSAESGGVPVAGTMNSARTQWHSTWALSVSARYSVTASATAPGATPVTKTSAFTTLAPARTFQTQIFEGAGQTYGVGMPIMLKFSEPIVNKAAVEQSLQLTTSQPVVGAWSWDGSEELNFRPRQYWPAHTTVSFAGHLDGVQAAPGLYGDHTLTQTFTIGDSLIVVASTTAHRMDLYRNGALTDSWPISTGRPGDNTPNGTYVTIEKGNPVLMTGPGYKLEVPWSVRFTFSGDYLHDAYWSVGEQGFTNVSHGCINMPPADAEAYYKLAVPGDPVTVTGSPRGGVWDNGWTEWFLSWTQYVQGSALHQAVLAGPDGSQFVSPAAVPAAAGTAPLAGPADGNAAA